MSLTIYSWNTFARPFVLNGCFMNNTALWANGIHFNQTFFCTFSHGTNTVVAPVTMVPVKQPTNALPIRTVFKASANTFGEPETSIPVCPQNPSTMSVIRDTLESSAKTVDAPVIIIPDIPIHGMGG